MCVSTGLFVGNVRKTEGRKLLAVCMASARYMGRDQWTVMNLPNPFGQRVKQWTCESAEKLLEILMDRCSNPINLKGGNCLSFAGHAI